ncbi:Rho GTPase-activating protein 7 [Nibea albiflora]|uniref:Rho GTPase-activating protein 7 n=1 Tax=Nibea albiflora TaxID=240163 RepID=A0ACB7FKT4_NIBAL|nr:Rho GTPase-activating protein 7 [Nibea albiflora]
MPVAIRKRSWEEHVTHASGLQYSYDDLDLVCCHGVDSEGPWMGAGASKQGRRTRCASMPEGCHQLPTEDLARTFNVTTSVVNDDTGSEELKESNVKIPLDFQENSSHSEKTVNGEGEAGTESRQSHDICNDDNVFKSPHISREEQQCISISSNNESPLSESAGEQPGKLPNHQETKESHTEGYSRPPEISEDTLNQSSAAELEPQTDLPDVEEEKISTPGLADASVTLPGGVLHSSANMMEGGDGMSQANKTVEPVVTLVVKGACDGGVTESCSADSAEKLDGLSDSDTLNENTGLKHQTRDIEGAERDRHDCNENWIRLTIVKYPTRQRWNSRTLKGR